MTDDLTQLTIKDASRLLRLGSISAADLVTAHVQRIERQTLRSQDIADLRGADAERQRAERPVRGCVAIAADYRHAGLREAELWADDVHDALPGAVHALDRDAEFAAIGFQLSYLLGGDRVQDR